ncbi:MAG: cellulose binding domain-containing protein [Bacillota bacterium]|nr:cellulose binding domain-containing protein [Bacillota bacterium]
MIRKNRNSKALLVMTLVSTMLFSLFPSSISVNAATTTATINVSAGAVNSTIPDTFYGSNLAAWTGNEDGANLLKNEFTKATKRNLFRWPGGSWGDAYIWDDMEVGGNGWIISYTECLDYLNKVGGTMQPIVNCGGVWNGVQHTNAEAVAKAAAWVKDMNITRKLGVKYWEIGNEMYGSWEAGYASGGKDYAQRYCNFYKAMKAVDPSIKCGAVGVETESGWNNWMATMFTEFKAQGIIPDFITIHIYPTINQSVSPANDAACLNAVSNVKGYTDSLNAMVSKYFGASYVGKIEYAMTEFSSTPSDHLYVDAMFNSQFFMECAKNKWAIANPWMDDVWYNSGYVTPTYYIYPFLQEKFGRQLVTATSSDSMVRSYAAKDNDGNLTLFLINNSPSDTTTANINISGFNSSSSGEKWTIEPTYTGFNSQIPNSSTNQEWDDLKINGVVHPDIRKLDDQVASSIISTGSSFSVNMPSSSMVFIKLLPEGKTPVQKVVSTPASLVVSNPPSTTGPIKIQYKCNETGNSSSSVRFSFNVVNTSNKEVSLDDLVVRYWYTREGPLGWESFNCDYSEKTPKTSVTGTFYNIYRYLDIRLGSGTIPAGGTSGEFQIRWSYGDSSSINQANDYSFTPSINSLTDYMKMSLYLKGDLIWGTEPAGLRPPKLLSGVNTATPTPVPTPTSTSTSIVKLADLNGDKVINMADVILMASAFNAVSGDEKYKSAYDLNSDGAINMSDVIIIAAKFNTTV